MSRYPIYDCDNSYVLVSLKVKLRLPRAYLTLGAHRLKHRTKAIKCTKGCNGQNRDAS